MKLKVFLLGIVTAANFVSKIGSRSVIHFETFSAHPLGKRADSTANTLSLDDSIKTLFAMAGKVQMGTPPQEFQILFDTGSFQYWVRDGACGGNSCAGLSMFKSEQSTTYRSIGKVESLVYTDGTSIRGPTGIDEVGVLGLASKIAFIQATEFNARYTEQDGIMGLGFPVYGEKTNLVAELHAAKTIALPVFSYYIDSTEKKGGLTIGGVDTSKYAGNLLWVPLIGSVGSETYATHWNVALKSFAISNNGTFADSGYNIIFDSGTSLVIMEKSLASQINTALGLSVVQRAGTYGVLCPGGIIPAGPNITIALETGNLILTPKEYFFIAVIGGLSVCVSGIQGGDVGKTIIFGNVFLRRFYTVHDQGNFKIGFAVSNRNAALPEQFVAQDSTDPPVGSGQGSFELYPAGSNQTASNLTLVRSAALPGQSLSMPIILLIIQAIFLI